MRRVLPLLLLPALLAVPAAADTAAHRIHGTVVLHDGREFTGFLRQEGDDSCWDHLFEARREVSPWRELVDEDALAKERREAFFREHGLIDRLAYVLSGDDRRLSRARSFICRYRDLASLETVSDGDEVLAVMADGSEHRLRAGSRDLGGDLVVDTGEEEPTVVDWDRVRRVDFSDAPPGADAGPDRLWGELETADGTFRGWIRWDRSEALADDVLDGEDPAGTDHEIPMGDIAAIARVDGRSCRVTLRDGAQLVLSGTNDVNDDNRGIVVETAEFGRAVADWETFRRLDFRTPPPGSGPPARHTGDQELRGEVETFEGTVHAGRLVLDLDEGWGWEILDGHHGGIEYEIPLAEVASLARDRDGVCRVTTRRGPVLIMSSGQDTGPSNRGVLVLQGRMPTQLAWAEVAEVRFR